MLRSSPLRFPSVLRQWLRVKNRTRTLTQVEYTSAFMSSFNVNSAMTPNSGNAYLNSKHMLVQNQRGVPPTEASIDRSLHRLDTEIRRVGRINRFEIDEILNDIRQMKYATSSQSLMIIRCCGELVPEETAENRTKLVQEVMKTMEKLNVPMDISHYNALLRVYLENEFKFNPTEFLQLLDAKGLEPNRVTYQRLIERFCQDGDIDGASTILQHMKEKQLPINAHVFNSLILGHAQSNDMESAEGIIGVMKQAGLEPNDDTYATLLKGYAKQGNMENINRIVKECREKDIFLVDRDFLDVIYTLASSKHENLVDEIFPLLKKHVGFNQEATNIVLGLVNVGLEDVAFKLVKIMERPMRQEELAPGGNFFIKQLVISSVPAEKIINFCHEMVRTGLNKHALVRACEFSLFQKQFDKAFDLLEALKESDFPIRQHYFWSFFPRSKTEKEVYDGIKCMMFLENPPNFETLKEYIIPALFRVAKPKEPFEVILEKLSAYARVPLSLIIPAAIQHILYSGQMELAEKFALKYRVRFNQVGIRRALVEAFLRNGDHKSLVRIIGSTGADGDENARENAGMIILELLEHTRHSNKVNVLKPILAELLTNGLGLSNSAGELIQNNLSEVLTPEISNLLLQLTSSSLKPKVELYYQPGKVGMGPVPQETSVADLEAMLEEGLAAGRPNNGIRRSLLFSYCRSRSLEKSEKLIQDLKADGFVFNAGLKSVIFELYSYHDKLEEAESLYNELIKEVGFCIDDLKILRYALCLLTNGKLEDAFAVLEGHKSDEKRPPGGAYQNATVWKLLNTLADSGSVENVRRMFSILKDRNLTQLNNVILGPLVKVHIVRDDLEGALNEFERCVNEYSVTPWKQELFCRFIKAEDADRLQKVLDLSTKQHGEVNSLYDLVFAFLECGKLRQAKKIMETPGLRARNEKLEFTCQKYLDEDRISELENLLEITKDVFNIDRNSLYFFLLKAYCKQGEPEKALSVWTSLQEENIQASSELLIYLADFLQKSDRTVPFIVPSPKVEEQVQSVGLPITSGSTRSDITTLKKYIEDNEIDKALHLKQKMEVEGKSVSVRERSLLIEKLTRAERLGEAVRLSKEMLVNGQHPFPTVLNFLLGRISATGDIDAINSLGDSLTDELKKLTLFISRLCICYVNAGKGKEYFNQYVKKEVEALVSGAKTSLEVVIPASACTHIINKNEDLLPEFELLAEVAGEKGFIGLHQSLWTFYNSKKEFKKARDVWETKLKSSKRLLFRNLLKQGRANSDEVLVKEVTNQILSSEALTTLAKGLALSYLVDVLCDKSKPEEALEVVNLHLGTIPLEDINRSTLVTLKEKLESKSISFPHEIPEKKSRISRKEESDSSSDSDSDHEGK